MTEPGKATLVAILNEVRAGRAENMARVNDHEARIRVLERKNMAASAIVSGVVSVIVALVAAFGAGCAVPQKDPGTLSREATVEIEVVSLSWGGGSGSGSGTGWYIATDGERSIIATAGHVCDTGPEDAVVYTTSDGAVAFPIYDHDEWKTDDVCLLQVFRASRPLRVGGVPDLGDKVFYTGYPAGTLGTYHGEVSAVEEEGVVLVSVPTYPGASGSAVMDESTGRVVGMLVVVDTYFYHHAWCVGSAALHRARDFAVDYLDLWKVTAR